MDVHSPKNGIFIGIDPYPNGKTKGLGYPYSRIHMDSPPSPKSSMAEK